MFKLKVGQLAKLPKEAQDFQVIYLCLFHIQVDLNLFREVHCSNWKIKNKLININAGHRICLSFKFGPTTEFDTSTRVRLTHPSFQLA